MIEERIRRAAEQILGDSSLTEYLDDSDAQRLLDWALSISRRAVEQTASMADADADLQLEEVSTNLRKAVRRISKLAGTLGESAPDEVAEQMSKILEAAVNIPGLSGVSIDPDQVAHALQGQPPAAALTTLLGLFSTQTGETMPGDAASTPPGPAESKAAPAPGPVVRPGAPPREITPRVPPVQIVHRPAQPHEIAPRVPPVETVPHSPEPGSADEPDTDTQKGVQDEIRKE